jgi:hypothetical protein
MMLVVFAAVAQDGPQPDQWRGLKLGVAEPAAAIQALGSPATDKLDRLLIQRVTKWFESGLRGKKLRKLSFRDVQGFSSVDLYYRDDKLVVIQLQPKERIEPSALPNIYGVTFSPVVSGFEESMAPQDFERHAGSVYPKTYPAQYGLVAVAARSVIVADVFNSGLGSVLRQSAGVRDTAGGGFPGKVSRIQLISRDLENRSGSNLLR